MKKWIGKTFLKAYGWEVAGEMPKAARCVVIAAPHTTNWDFPFTIAIGFAAGVRFQFLGKHTLFRFPLGILMRAAGGIPVRRSKSHNMVESAAQILRDADDLKLLVPAEGTRSRREHWKSGFYHIARAADVPIVLGYLDFEKKQGGFGPAVMPTEDVKAVMDEIRAFYADKKGKYPKNFGPIRLREEPTGLPKAG